MNENGSEVRRWKISNENNLRWGGGSAKPRPDNDFEYENEG